MNQELSMSPNLLVAALQKPASEFTKADIVSYIKENDIRMVNFMYPAADGRLKAPSSTPSVPTFIGQRSWRMANCLKRNIVSML